MAKSQISMPDEFLNALSKLGEHIDDITEQVLISGGEVLESKVRENLKSIIGRGTKFDSRSTGQLVSSLGLSTVKKDRDGNSNIKIGFSEHRNDAKTNALIANTLEYGKHGQRAKPFLKPAVKAAKQECETAMMQTFSSEVKKLDT